MKDREMKDKKTIFLTGASGNMGGAALHELLQRSDRFRVKALVLPIHRNEPAMQLARYADHPDLEIVWGDLTNYDDVLRGVTGADQVVHIGGLVSPAADRVPDLTMKVNVGAALNIVRAIKAQPDSNRVKLVNIGTVAQTGHRAPPIHWGRAGDPIKISMFDQYAVSKTQAEAIIAESGLQYWVSLRQTGIAHSQLWRIFDPIMFHSPFNSVFEWVTVGDAGRLAANVCEDCVPEHFWRSFYNISGGERMRVVNHEFAAAATAAMGLADFRTMYRPNWFASRNFHGQWYTDADTLEALVPFRQETLADYVEHLKNAIPFYVKWGVRFATATARKRIQRLAESEGGPLYWLAHDDSAHINAYFGSRDAWEKIPTDWDRFVLEQPSRVPTQLDHGYDERKPAAQWTLADLRQAAEFRGGAYRSNQVADPYVQTEWTCCRGHEFSMSANLMLRGGHWCPHCMIDPASYEVVAARSPFFAQVWREGY